MRFDLAMFLMDFIMTMDMMIRQIADITTDRVSKKGSFCAFYLKCKVVKIIAQIMCYQLL